MDKTEALSRLRDMTGLNDPHEQDAWPDSRLEWFLDTSQIRDDDMKYPGEDEYTETWDMPRAAASVLRARAADVARYGFQNQTDMTTAHRQQIVQNFLRLAREYERRREPVIYSPVRDLVRMNQEEPGGN